MFEKHPEILLKNQENFLNILAIFSNTKILPKKIAKNLLIHSDFFFLKLLNQPETSSRKLTIIAYFLCSSFS